MLTTVYKKAAIYSDVKSCILTQIYSLQRSFGHPNALRWCRSLLRHLISHLATYFYFKK